MDGKYDDEEPREQRSPLEGDFWAQGDVDDDQAGEAPEVSTRTSDYEENNSKHGKKESQVFSDDFWGGYAEHDTERKKPGANNNANEPVLNPVAEGEAKDEDEDNQVVFNNDFWASPGEDEDEDDDIPTELKLPEIPQPETRRETNLSPVPPQPDPPTPGSIREEKHQLDDAPPPPEVEEEDEPPPPGPESKDEDPPSPVSESKDEEPPLPVSESKHLKRELFIDSKHSVEQPASPPPKKSSMHYVKSSVTSIDSAPPPPPAEDRTPDTPPTHPAKSIQDRSSSTRHPSAHMRSPPPPPPPTVNTTESAVSEQAVKGSHDRDRDLGALPKGWKGFLPRSEAKALPALPVLPPDVAKDHMVECKELLEAIGKAELFMANVQVTVRRLQNFIKKSGGLSNAKNNVAIIAAVGKRVQEWNEVDNALDGPNIRMFIHQIRAATSAALGSVQEDIDKKQIDLLLEMAKPYGLIYLPSMIRVSGGPPPVPSFKYLYWATRSAFQRQAGLLKAERDSLLKYLTSHVVFSSALQVNERVLQKTIKEVLFSIPGVALGVEIEEVLKNVCSGKTFADFDELLENIKMELPKFS